MRFYHCFHTDLPDQFVDANSRHLIRWVENWRDNPYLIRSKIVDSVEVDLTGQPSRDNWPTLKSRSARMVGLWLHSKGANYNGRYWESLAEDQRSPDRKSGTAGRNDTLDAWLYAAGTVTNAVTPTSPGLRAIDIAQLKAMYDAFARSNSWALNGLLDEYETRKAPLKREGIVAGEIVGYRCWKVRGGLLRSVYQKDVWQPGQILEGRELGDWDSRGIHAWKDPGSKHYHDYIRGYLNQENDPRSVHYYPSNAFVGASVANRPAMVTGTVFLWGDVVEHERGYRAEFARVRSLDWLYPDETMMGREQEALDELRAKYVLTSRLLKE